MTQLSRKQKYQELRDRRSEERRVGKELPVLTIL